ncbi:MAG: DNA double-strand break repair nuclease NurA [Mycobacteriales bacterium]
MRFWVDAWDPSYGTSADPGDDSDAVTDLDVELPVAGWRAVPAGPVTVPVAVHFVDGVRRIDAHVWIDGPDGAVAGLAASYAAGVVSCRPGEARADVVDVRRGLFTSAPGATGVRAPLVDYPVHRTAAGDELVLSLALQRALAATEVDCAARARTDRDDLLVVDGPLLAPRGQLTRVLGLIKTHRRPYLEGEPHALVGRLRPGERTPVFRIGTRWARCCWYLRLPGRPGAPWAGVVRVECPDRPTAEVVELAALSQAVLPRFASTEHKDQRAPQNLYPIAGLERLLRRRLGDRLLLDRALRRAAATRA